MRTLYQNILNDTIKCPIKEDLKSTLNKDLDLKHLTVQTAHTWVKYTLMLVRSTKSTITSISNPTFSTAPTFRTTPVTHSILLIARFPAILAGVFQWRTLNKKYLGSYQNVKNYIMFPECRRIYGLIISSKRVFLEKTCLN